jgi:hypothetical protein
LSLKQAALFPEQSCIVIKFNSKKRRKTQRLLHRIWAKKWTFLVKQGVIKTTFYKEIYYIIIKRRSPEPAIHQSLPLDNLTS